MLTSYVIVIVITCPQEQRRILLRHDCCLRCRRGGWRQRRPRQVRVHAHEYEMANTRHYSFACIRKYTCILHSQLNQRLNSWKCMSLPHAPLSQLLLNSLTDTSACQTTKSNIWSVLSVIVVGMHSVLVVLMRCFDDRYSNDRLCRN